MQQGLYEKIFNELFDSVNSDGFIELEDIKRTILKLRHYELDAHVIIEGFNGAGKSRFGLSLAKELEPTLFENNKIVYATTEPDALINKFVEERNTVLFIDELTPFFNYKASMTRAQVALFTAVELCRDRRIAIIGCCREVLRLNNNYRNGKAQILVMLLDRMENPNPVASYALVFATASPREREDRFNLHLLNNCTTPEQIRAQAEWMDSFVGYIEIPNSNTFLTDAELKAYQEGKEKGIKAQALKAAKRAKGEKGDSDYTGEVGEITVMGR